ncbi:RluA family pseudouridine synthase [Gracilibacillus sp. YIM 98692]|uniref:RluA family pseudouridine synthase n=1 Tax=Gracilibacillus sp. YIM 98692 TaxID=2663532 RepID=UPI0013CFA80F|nr:RluA family pseudouridine synthase [Gracilibacillus sp. YIM 98692]
MKWQVDKQHEQLLLRDYLSKVKGMSRRTLNAVKYDGGEILVNGIEVNVRYVLKEKDLVEVIFPPEKRSELVTPKYIPLNIVYEDSDILVLNKAAYMATIPSFHHLKNTLANGIIYHYNQQGLPYTVHVVTRLDRDTSGLLLIAKHRYSHSILMKDQKSGVVNRTYRALVSGHLQKKKGSIQLPIGRHPDSILERKIDPNGQEAITNYEVISEWEDYSLLSISLETGRTHQIRVHFTHLGHPLLGDKLYKGDRTQINRQALHCESISFYHPIKKDRMHFSVPLPEDMEPLVARPKNFQNKG